MSMVFGFMRLVAPTRLYTHCVSFTKTTVYRRAIGARSSDTLVRGSIPIHVNVQHRAIPWACY
jgi:hypothetical protein